MFALVLILFTSWILFGLFLIGVLGFNLMLAIGWLIGVGFLLWFSIKVREMEKKEIRRFIIGFVMVIGVIEYAIYNGHLTF